MGHANRAEDFVTDLYREHERYPPSTKMEEANNHAGAVCYVSGGTRTPHHECYYGNGVLSQSTWLEMRLGGLLVSVCNHCRACVCKVVTFCA